MAKTSLKFEQSINAPAAAVYYAFTNQVALVQWLCDSARISAREGAPLFLRWHGANYYAIGEFTRLKANKAVEFSWFGRGEPAPTRVKVRLTEDAGVTSVQLVHKKVGKGKKWSQIRAQIKNGWKSGLANLKQVLETGVDMRVFDRPMLGVYIAGEVSAEKAAELGLSGKGGVKIAGAISGTGAEAAGLVEKDIILSLDGTAVTDFRTLGDAIRPHKAGDTVEVILFRDGTQHALDMVLSRRPVPDTPSSPAEFAKALRAIYDELDEELDVVVADVTDAEADYKSAENEWSAKDILAHLITTERGFQMSLALNIDHQDLSGWPDNPPAWIKSVADSYTWDEILPTWKQAESETVAFVANLPDDTVSRKVTYLNLANLFLIGLPTHTRSHLDDIRQLIKAAREVGAD